MKTLAIVLLVLYQTSLVIAQEWTEHIIDNSFDGAFDVCATDIDGDGDIDVVGAANTGNAVAWWENTDGMGTTWTEHTLYSHFDGAKSVYAIDLDGDGDIDVLGAVQSADKIIWGENLDGMGTLWAAHTVDDDFNGANFVHATDMDGDGDIDVLGASLFDTIMWWENTDGAGATWTEHTIDGDYDMDSVCAADLDGDGDIDVLGSGHFMDYTSWWENLNGSGTQWFEHTSTIISGLISAYATDVNGDGDIDLVGSAILEGSINWWENRFGHGTNWIEHIVDNIQAYKVSAADLDGDNDIDVLSTWDAYPCYVSWWENADGGGMDWFEHFVGENLGHTRSLQATDLDGDGSTDVLCASLLQIVWWENPLITSVRDQTQSNRPTEFKLILAYPNPFNPTTNFAVELPKPSDLTVTVYNVTGQQVAELANGSYTAGTHRFTFDATNLSSGIYFLRATVPGQLDQTQKLVLMK